MLPAQPVIDDQKAFWNDWNATNREHTRFHASTEQANVIHAWFGGLGRGPRNILEIGCGTGWLCSELTRYGDVTGTDLSDEVLARAAVREPRVRFMAGDFAALPVPAQTYDVAVSLEVLSHVADQPAFLRKVASVLKPGGYLMLATQNAPALRRNAIPPPGPGQLRHWVDRHKLRQLLGADFTVEELFSITPRFNRGLLRYVNSPKAHRLLQGVGLGAVSRGVVKLQEQAWLGWTLMALARKHP